MYLAKVDEGMNPWRAMRAVAPRRTPRTGAAAPLERATYRAGRVPAEMGSAFQVETGREERRSEGSTI